MLSNNINNFYNRQVPFWGIKFKTLEPIKLFDEIHCEAKIKNQSPQKDYFVRIENGYTPQELSIIVDDLDFDEIGTSTLWIKDENTLYNRNIDVRSNKKKSLGAGSVMKLGEIITMLENNIDKIELHSLGQAVYFHSKFKFKPAITDFNELTDYINYDILNKSNNPKFKHVCELAEKWLNKKSLSHKHLEEGNNILYEYLQTVIENKLNRDEEFEISPGFDMVLTRQDILKNKEYFNALFRKFDIDYQISDSFCSVKTS